MPSGNAAISLNELGIICVLTWNNYNPIARDRGGTGSTEAQDSPQLTDVSSPTALPLADPPQPPRRRLVLSRGAWRPLLPVKEVSKLTCATSGEVASHTKVSAPFCGLRDNGLRIVIANSISRPLLWLNPVATSPGWKQFAVTPVPS